MRRSASSNHGLSYHNTKQARCLSRNRGTGVSPDGLQAARSFRGPSSWSSRAFRRKSTGAVSAPNVGPPRLSTTDTACSTAAR